MARRTAARHARPRRRGPFAAVESPLASDVAQLRAASFSDYLELVRLSALVDGLVAQADRLSREIPEVRRELHEARTAPRTPDPAVDLLATEVADLRATVSAQNALLTDLTRHVLDLLTRLAVQATSAVPTVPAVSTDVPVPVPSPVTPQTQRVTVTPAAGRTADDRDPVADDEGRHRLEPLQWAVQPAT